MEELYTEEMYHNPDGRTYSIRYRRPYIYCLTNTTNGKKYVGKANDPDSRFKGHMQRLAKGNHPVEDMQKDYDKGHRFEMSILEITTWERDCLEYYWMAKTGSCFREQGYNYKDHVSDRIRRRLIPNVCFRYGERSAECVTRFNQLFNASAIVWKSEFYGTLSEV